VLISWICQKIYLLTTPIGNSSGKAWVEASPVLGITHLEGATRPCILHCSAGSGYCKLPIVISRLASENANYPFILVQ
jgi:hypothetical protein